MRSAWPDGYVRVRIPLDDNWLAVYELGERDGEPVIGEVRVLPLPKSRKAERELKAALSERPITYQAEKPSRPLTARTLRRLSPGLALELARETLLELPGKYLVGFHGIRPEALTAPRRPGRRGRSDRFWAEIAVLYVEALSRGSRRPIADVAGRLSAQGEPYSQSRVRDVVREARVRGLLTPAEGRGRAGGQLTERAKSILEDEQQ